MIIKKVTGEDCNAIKLRMGYNKGGINYFTYKQEDRGFYLSLTPMKIEKHKLDDGREYETESYMFGSGYRIPTKPITKKSEKAFKEAIEELKTKDTLIKQCILQILEEQDLLLDDTYDIDFDKFSYGEI